MARLPEELLRDEEPMSYPEFRRALATGSESIGEWAGIPIPLEDYALRVEDRYPWKAIEFLAGGAPDEQVCSDADIKDLHVRNTWYSRSRAGWVTVYSEAPSPRSKFLFEPRWRYAERLGYWLRMCGVIQAWDLDAEAAAIEKFSGLVSEHILRMYLLTGTFLETSKRSGVHYLFRRSRPTVALTAARKGDPEASIRCLAVLCLHPIAYYAQTWAGAMVPTDDVIAHLTMMRADEHGFWRRANQHNPESPEAGI